MTKHLLLLLFITSCAVVTRAQDQPDKDSHQLESLLLDSRKQVDDDNNGTFAAQDGTQGSNRRKDYNGGNNKSPLLVGGTEAAAKVGHVTEITRQKRIPQFILPAIGFFGSVGKMSSVIGATSTKLLSFMKPVLSKLTLSGVLGGIGDVVGLVTGIMGVIPDGSHEEIMRELSKIHNAIANVRDDIKRLEKHVDWRHTQTQYFPAVSVIRTAVDILIDIGKARTDKAKQHIKRRFIDHCRSQGLHHKVQTLIEGISKSSSYFHHNILERYSAQSGGHCSNLIKLSARLTSLMSGGITSLIAYERLLAQKEGVQYIKNKFQPKLRDATKAISGAISSCIGQFPQNAKKDIDRIMENGGSNSGLTKSIWDILHEKYDWNYFAALVYNDIGGWDKHTLGGCNFLKLHHRGKCYCVINVNKKHRFRSQSYKGTMEGYVRSVSMNHARNTYDQIKRELEQKGISWKAMVIIKRYVDLRMTYSTALKANLIWELGRYMTKMVLLY